MSSHLSSPGSLSALPSSVRDVLDTPGDSLDGETRSFMEGRFGQDFSGVKIHVGAEAAHSAKAVSANAYTLGNHIVFGAGRYAPYDVAARPLIAHELAHVVQQARGGANETFEPGGSLERSAAAAAAAVAQGAARIDVRGASQPALARDPTGTPPPPPGPSNGVVLEIEITPEMNANDARRKASALDDLAKRGKLERAESPLPARRTVQGGVAAEQYQQINPTVSTEYKYRILDQAHRQFGPNSPNYDPDRWRRFFDLWKRSQGDHVHELQLKGADTLDNVWLIDALTNNAIGRQIRLQLLKLAAGTKIIGVRLKAPLPGTPAPTTTTPAAAGTEATNAPKTATPDSPGPKATTPDTPAPQSPKAPAPAATTAPQSPTTPTVSGEAPRATPKAPVKSPSAPGSGVKAPPPRPGLGNRIVTGATREIGAQIRGFFSPQNLAVMIIDMAVQYWIETRERAIAEQALVQKISSADVQQRIAELVSRNRASIVRRQFSGQPVYMNIDFTIPSTNKMVRDVRFSRVTESDTPESRWSCVVMSHGMPFFGSMSEEETCYVTVAATVPDLEITQSEATMLRIEQLEAMGRDEKTDPALIASYSEEVNRLRSALPQQKKNEEQASERALASPVVPSDPVARAAQQREINERLRNVAGKTQGGNNNAPAAGQPQKAPPSDFVAPAPGPAFAPLPGAPGEDPARAAVRLADQGIRWAQDLEQRGIALRQRLGSSSRPSEKELSAYFAEVTQWQLAVKTALIAYRDLTAAHDATEKLGRLLDSTAPKLRHICIELGGPGEG